MTKKEFKHAPDWADVEVLQATGCWPNGEIPKWAQEIADAWDCDPACGAVREYAAKHEIERLRDEVQKLQRALYGEVYVWPPID